MNAFYRLFPDAAKQVFQTLTLFPMYYLLKLLKFCIWRNGCKSLTDAAKVTKGAGLSKGSIIQTSEEKD